MAADVGVQLPVGVVTLLFSDIEGSTRLLEVLGDGYGDVIAEHHRLLREVWRAHRGVEVGTDGDAFFVAFADPHDAVHAALAAQRTLKAHDWPGGLELRVRMGLHTGAPRIREGDYWGVDVHYAARLCSAAHGGQVLLSERTVLFIEEPVEDLGEHALKDFPAARHIFHLIVDGCCSDDFPAPRTLRAGRTNLPDQVSRFVGRERELSELSRTLLDARMVTLTGAGGVGKTRLALQLAAELLDGTGDGVWLVDLAPLPREALVGPAVASVLDIREEPGRPVENVLVQAIRDRELLLVLDNCEHVITEAASLVDRLLQRCPRVVILATSREPLGIAGEYLYRVPSLSVPPTEDAEPEELVGYEGVRLFLDRAAQQRPGFSLDGRNGPTIARLCRRLDGIPLAIELAAARLGSLSAADIVAHLDQRFRLLTGGARTALPRQQTLQALIDWSYDLLDRNEQKLLASLSVFAGSFDLHSAEAVASGPEDSSFGILDELAALVYKSLVQADDTGTVRYRLLESVRDYAAAKLALRGEIEANAVRSAHRDHFLALAEAAAPHLTGEDQVEWLDRLELELDNLRAAISTCLLDPDPEPGLRVAAALRYLWLYRRPSREGIIAVCAALDRPDARAPTLARSRALVAAALLLWRIGRVYDEALAHAEEARAIAEGLGDERLAAEALYALALVTNSASRDHDGKAREVLSEAMRAAHALRDPMLTGLLLVVAASSDDPTKAEGVAMLEECLVIFRESGNRVLRVEILGNLGYRHMELGQFDAARVQLDEAVRLAREIGFPRGICFVVCNLGFASYLGGDDDTARTMFDETLRIAGAGEYAMIAYAQLGFALLATRAGNAAEAARLHGEADGIHAQLGTHWQDLEAPLRDADVARVRAMLGDVAFQAAYDAGRARAFETPAGTSGS